jgi:SAM-dependent methyltransferase
MRDRTHYDRAYFDKWYRHPRHRVKSPLDIARQIRFVVSAAEYLLERPVRRVLDVGAGEGNWLPPLRKVRPGVKYYGVDASAYAVRRWGTRRNIRLGTFGTLGTLGLPDAFDVVLCCGVLMYVDPDELRVGLREIARLSAGVCYFEVFTSADDASGDFNQRAARSPGWWRREIESAGFVNCGMHLWLPRRMAGLASAMERADSGS